MAKQKKNSNYQTEKNLAEKARQEEEKLKKEQTKKIKDIAIVSGVTAAIVGLVLTILIVAGVFKYHPEVTAHAEMEIDEYGSFHIELYGKDAPDAVEKFLECADKMQFDNKQLHTLKDGMLYGGAETLTNGSENSKNKVALEKGVICVKYSETACQFYIITEKNAKPQDGFIAIGKIDDLAVLDKILAAVETDGNGKITSETAPLIISVSDHEAHH